MIKKTLKYNIIIFLSALIFSFHVVAAQRNVIVGVSAERPPFAFIKNGKIVGFDVDLMIILANNLEYTVEFQDMEFQELFTALENEQIDATVSAISATDERGNSANFSVGYYFPRLAILTRKNSKISSLKKLKGKTIATIAQTTMQQFFIKNLNVDKK